MSESRRGLEEPGLLEGVSGCGEVTLLGIIVGVGFVTLGLGWEYDALRDGRVGVGVVGFVTRSCWKPTTPLKYQRNHSDIKKY